MNPKRAYRVMAVHELLLPKAPRRRRSNRPHDGVVAVRRTATFAKDRCDREIMAWRAWPGKGLPGEPVREMLIEGVAGHRVC